MTNKPKTDRVDASSASEFVWDTEDHTEVHKFIGKPILDQLEQAGVHSVLDLGCGNGAFTAALAEKGYQVVGMDHSLSGVSIAQQKHSGLEFHQHDLADPLDERYREQFDCVVSVEVLEHLLLPRSLMRNALHALKPGGLLILTTPYHGYLKNLALALTNKFDSHWHPLRDYGHIKFFSKDTLSRLAAEFDIQNIHITTVGRIPAFARSMILSGTKAA